MHCSHRNGRCGQPGRRAVGDDFSPRLDCRHEGILKGILCQLEIARVADEAGEDEAVLLAVDGLDRPSRLEPLTQRSVPLHDWPDFDAEVLGGDRLADLPFQERALLLKHVSIERPAVEADQAARRPVLPVFAPGIRAAMAIAASRSAASTR